MYSIIKQNLVAWLIRGSEPKSIRPTLCAALEHKAATGREPNLCSEDVIVLTSH